MKESKNKRKEIKQREQIILLTNLFDCYVLRIHLLNVNINPQFFQNLHLTSPHPLFCLIDQPIPQNKISESAPGDFTYVTERDTAFSIERKTINSFINVSSLFSLERKVIDPLMNPSPSPKIFFLLFD